MNDENEEVIMMSRLGMGIKKDILVMVILVAVLILILHTSLHSNLKYLVDLIYVFLGFWILQVRVKEYTLYKDRWIIRAPLNIFSKEKVFYLKDITGITFYNFGRFPTVRIRTMIDGIKHSKSFESPDVNREEVILGLRKLGVSVEVQSSAWGKKDTRHRPRSRPVSFGYIPLALARVPRVWLTSGGLKKNCLNQDSQDYRINRIVLFVKNGTINW